MAVVDSCKGRLAVFVLCTLAFAPFGSGLQCYVCNSVKDRGCTDQPDPTYLRNCSELSEHRTYVLCRKIDQIVPPAEGLDTSPRTIRECGWEETPDSCYQKHRYGGLQNVCTCYTDGCNESVAAKPIFNCYAYLILFALIGSAIF